MSRVLVTGGAGFIGSHTVRALLARGHEVVVLARPATSLARLDDVAAQVRIVRGELADPGALVSALGGWRPECCAHLAWYADPATYLVARENLAVLAGSTALVARLLDAGCPRFVITGTCSEYAVRDTPLTEAAPVEPLTLYAASKLSLLLVSQQLARQVGAAVAWARIFYLYGPCEPAGKLVPAAIRTLLRGEEFAASAGTQVRDYLHVADVAAGLCALVESELEGVVNVCSGVPVTVRHVLEEIGRLLDAGERIRFGEIGPRKVWDPPYLCGDNSRLRRETGWSPGYRLTAGLAATVDWWRTHD